MCTRMSSYIASLLKQLGISREFFPKFTGLNRREMQFILEAENATNLSRSSYLPT